MKTLIVHSGKHGCTAKCATKIGELLNHDYSIIPVEQCSDRALISYDSIIIGSSIYMGKIDKKCLAFCLSNLEEITRKKLGLFICGMNQHQAENIVDSCFPASLTQATRLKGFFGGEVDFNKLNVINGLMVKAVLKKDERFKKIDLKNIVTSLDEKEIAEFAAKVNQLAAVADV